MSKGVIQVDGSRSAKTVAKVARHFIPSLRRCYEAALTRRARVRGELVIAFTIRGDGTIAEAAPRASTLGAPEVGECVARIISKWRFASGGGQATVVLPIRYSPR